MKGQSLALVMVLLLGGCGSDSPTGPGGPGPGQYDGDYACTSDMAVPGALANLALEVRNGEVVVAELEYGLDLRCQYIRRGIAKYRPGTPLQGDSVAFGPLPSNPVTLEACSATFAGSAVSGSLTFSYDDGTCTGAWSTRFRGSR